ncbi:hypothetical protein THAOC_31075, partial [Thalassiosira oceanica]
MGRGGNESGTNTKRDSSVVYTETDGDGQTIRSETHHPYHIAAEEIARKQRRARDSKYGGGPDERDEDPADVTPFVSTIAVNFEHLSEFDQDLADAVEGEAVRFEPYLRRAAREFGGPARAIPEDRDDRPPVVHLGDRDADVGRPAGAPRGILPVREVRPRRTRRRAAVPPDPADAVPEPEVSEPEPAGLHPRGGRER